MKQDLLKKIDQREAKICIIGLGYVGLPLAVAIARAGFKVLGIENNPSRAAQVNEGRNYINDIADKDLENFVKKGLIHASVDFKPIQQADIVIICVPTPLNKNKEPDISYIQNATDEIVKNFHKHSLIVLESTTYPGTTEEIIYAQLEKKNLKLGRDFLLSFSPERVDPGNKNFNTVNTEKIVGGLGADSLEVATHFYRTILDKVIPVSSPRVAEMTKVFENIYRSVNIALVNELSVLCERMDIDVYEVIKAADTKPYGFQAFWPGPGVGGHCIPLDPYYLSWKGREYDMHVRFIELAGEINENRPRVVVSKVIEILNHFSKPLKNSKILQLGVAYKKDIDDDRESPALHVYELLTEAGAHVDVVDPMVKEFWIRAHDFTYGNSGPGIKTLPLSDSLLESADLVLLLTDHSSFPYEKIHNKSKLIFDTRNAFGFREIASKKIIKLSTLINSSYKL